MSAARHLHAVSNGSAGRTRQEEEANLASLTAQVHELPDDFLECRDLRHAWKITRDYELVHDIVGGPRGARYADRVATCLRCEAMRVELYRVWPDRLERLGPPRYSRPKGYDLKGKKQGYDVIGLVRKEQFDRVRHLLE